MKFRLLISVLLLCTMGQGAEPFKMCQVDVVTDKVISSACLTIQADTMESIDKYLVTLFTKVGDQNVLAYPNFFDFMVKRFADNIVGPILDTYPTANLQVLKDSAAAAQAAVDEAKAASLLKE